MNTQQYQMWTTRAIPPQGWKGSWPPSAPVGYPGPPPIPAGVNPQAWSAGQWQFNPMFQGPMATAQSTFQAWAPHPSWGPQGANGNAAASYNPYKRIPNPGDAAYWQTKLLDNPLGLENMHIRYVAISALPHRGRHVLSAPEMILPRTNDRRKIRATACRTRLGSGHLGNSVSPPNAMTPLQLVMGKAPGIRRTIATAFVLTCMRILASHLLRQLTIILAPSIVRHTTYTTNLRRLI